MRLGDAAAGGLVISSMRKNIYSHLINLGNTYPLQTEEFTQLCKKKLQVGDKQTNRQTNIATYRMN